MPEGGQRTSLVHAALALAAAGGRRNVAFKPAAFGPGEPVQPHVNEPPRAWDYPVSSNTVYTPRAQASFGFAELRAFANVELPRLAIETRKDQIERLDWRIKAKEERGEKSVDKARIRKVEALFNKPDGVTPLATFLRILLEDLLVIDAPTIEKRRTRGGELFGLEVVDGSTIKPLIDDTGRRPRAPLPSYQQVIKGIPWANLTTDDLVYSPRNMRPGHVYGYSPVEQLIVTINIALRRQAMQMAHFTAGNLPPGMINAPEGWTPDQLKQYAEWVDHRLAGNPAERQKILWAPHGAKWQAFQEAPVKDEFDEWLARMTCYAFSLPPTAFIKQLNRSTSETSDTTSLEEGREPLMRWWKRIADEIIQHDMGFPDLEWGWVIAEDVDPVKQAQTHDIYLKNGTLTHDQVRDRIGEAPIPGGTGSKHMIITSSGATLLEKVGEEPDAGAGEPKLKKPKAGKSE